MATSFAILAIAFIISATSFAILAIAFAILAIAANPVKILPALLLQIILIVAFVEFLPGKEGIIYLVARQRILNGGLCQFIAKYI
ncbi:hypothetical protein OGM63_14655 [Plectonema radiosum NIES-515]|uniref:Uncharacterized protein n=1 Tax=Plectonema radiosum NIES-515 TaxID=2986073 RepID=A0ABT3B051_9CYAN|nr:hypothetical protein [Plectonema radiosum]MCV3214742.1 hypothetical protein [Plectonema radiosum NIES-515]